MRQKAEDRARRNAMYNSKVLATAIDYLLAAKGELSGLYGGAEDGEPGDAIGRIAGDLIQRRRALATQHGFEIDDGEHQELLFG